MINNFLDFDHSLKKEFFLQDTETVAKQLLGKILVKRFNNNTIIAARIDETEAYLSLNDDASHSACGKTRRNAPMFASGGIAYVYFIYGVHFCFNIVTEAEGIGSAVLVRSGKPLMGIDEMQKNRNSNHLNKLCSGPGNFAKAFGFTTADNFLSLCEPNIFIYNDVTEHIITVSTRIGIKKSADLPLRFYITGSEYTSKK